MQNCNAITKLDFIFIIVMIFKSYSFIVLINFFRAKYFHLKSVSGETEDHESFVWKYA